MTDEATQLAQDAEEHRRSYAAIMKAGSEIGVPFSLGLTMFFTQLVMANGIFMALFAGVATYVFSHIVVKLFFSH